MIRLYPDWEDGDARVGQRSAGEDEPVSSSPVSVRSIEHAGQEAVNSIKQAIAGNQQPQDAFLTCNTFVNSVTDRERGHINTKLLREVSFQLNLLSTKLKDDADRLREMRSTLQSARANEARMNQEIQKQKAEIDTLKEDRRRLEWGVLHQEDRIALLEHQCALSTEDAGRQRVKAGKAMAELEDVRQQCEEWKQAAVKAKKKYHVLKNKIEDTKRAARRSHTQDASDDLVVI
uniref:Sphingomyelinase (SMase) (EC) n=1 Tax=Ganoderma boninense TaxID=34458 RepID=A0A5K1JSV8_9APHY|nr:Sphingomyelinase (SMase) (EC [Ganoderma boninense]